MENHIYIYIFEHKHIQIPMHTNARLIRTEFGQGLPEPSLTRTPAPCGFLRAQPEPWPGPLWAPAPHPEQLESAWWCTLARRWAGRGRQRGPGRGRAELSGEALSLPR